MLPSLFLSLSLSIQSMNSLDTYLFISMVKILKMNVQKGV